MKVVDISYKYGYDSPTSFTKAFQQFHGISPKDARDQNNELRVFPKMKISLKHEYSWKLEQKPAFRLIGKSTRIPCQEGSLQEGIPNFWSTCQRNGAFSELVSMDRGNPHGLFGFTGAYDESTTETEYTIGVISDIELPQDYEEFSFPEVTWAVFDCKGSVPQAIQNGWIYLQEEWLIKYPFRHAACPEIEWYSEGNPFDKNYFSQIWIPIIEDNQKGDS